MRAHFTPQAEIDLEEVGNYIALDNPRRAVSFIREIRQHCEKIADGPHHYVARPDLGDAIRICAHGNYPKHLDAFGIYCLLSPPRYECGGRILSPGDDQPVTKVETTEIPKPRVPLLPGAGLDVRS
jgi:plasmid stabilization system protein ParE